MKTDKGKHSSLLLDIGNTSVKAGIFKDRKLSAHFTLNQISELQNLFEFTKGIPCALSDVRGDAGLISEILALFPETYILTHESKLPLKISYDTPETLGRDRIAAALGAARLFPEKNILVIDYGTCITYDFVSRQGEYQGGNIAPGLNMRLKAMHEFTGKLPLVQPEGFLTDSLLGKSTEQALLNGAVFGIINETLSYEHQLEREIKDLTVLLSGGDGRFIFDKLPKGKPGIKRRFESHLVLFGLEYFLSVQEGSQEGKSS